MLGSGRLTLTLRVVNEAGADQRALAVAEKQAKSILDRAGVDLVWVACESGVGRGPADPCSRDRGPAEFWFRITARKPSSTTKEMLGFTELGENRRDRASGIYYAAALELAEFWGIRLGDVLGAAVAHEAGHLLLGADAHSTRGVMQPHWNRLQFDLIGLGRLSFTASEGKAIRDRIAALYDRSDSGASGLSPRDEHRRAEQGPN